MSSDAFNLQIEIADLDDPGRLAEVKELVWEYFEWGNSISTARHGFNFDISRMLGDFIDDRGNYKPPDGIMYLVRTGNHPIGTGGFKKINDSICELKRIYIRKAYRKTGLGSKLIERIIADARNSGYAEMHLESARFMEDAFRLYERFGFREIPIYSGVESPVEYQSIIYCMKLAL